MPGPWLVSRPYPLIHPPIHPSLWILSHFPVCLAPPVSFRFALRPLPKPFYHIHPRTTPWRAPRTCHRHTYLGQERCCYNLCPPTQLAYAPPREVPAFRIPAATSVSSLLAFSRSCIWSDLGSHSLDLWKSTREDIAPNDRITVYHHL